MVVVIIFIITIILYINLYMYKINMMNENQLRNKYINTNNKYLKKLLLNKLKFILQNKSYNNIISVLEKYKNEDIKELDMIYYSLIKNLINKDKIIAKDIRYYLTFIKNNNIKNLLIEKLVELNTQQLALLDDCDLVIKINKLNDNNIDRLIYINELSNRIKNREYNEKELINLVLTSSNSWLKNIFLNELKEKIKYNDIYSLNKTLVTLKDKDIIKIYKNIILDKSLHKNCTSIF